MVDSKLFLSKSGESIIGQVGIHPFEDTSEIEFSKNPIDRIIGQDLHLVKMAAKYRRNLLLVGVPGVGKSLIGKALAACLTPPKQEVHIVQNPEDVHRPKCEVVEVEPHIVDALKRSSDYPHQTIMPEDADLLILSNLNFICKDCMEISSSDLVFCPKCGRVKNFMNEIEHREYFDSGTGPINRCHVYLEVTPARSTPRIPAGTYERAGDHIKFYSYEVIQLKNLRMRKDRNIIVKIERNNFVQTIGSGRAALVGDIQHDPYGNDPQLGSPPHTRVLPGAIHDAHEGVLFVDEIAHIYNLQTLLFSAMQDKAFDISGSLGTGANVRVTKVPCDFVLVAATNFSTLKQVSPPLRSRIRNGGYELLLRDSMPITNENVQQFLRFISYEGSLENCYFSMEACDKILLIARDKARMKGKSGHLTLILREIAGVIKIACDFAKEEQDRRILETPSEQSTPFQAERTIVGVRHLMYAESFLERLEKRIERTYGSLDRAIEEEEKD